ncbi:MAG: SpaA isopeptide-forming pilin-related protein [bacterium]|nr:SpaA isopeptide-forming pilin-related protein [bacterium]
MKRKMFKNVQLFLAFALTTILFLGNAINVKAVAQTITLGSGEKIDDYLAGVSFQTKVTTSGEYVYCLDRTKATAKNTTATLVGERDAGFAYIIENGYPHKNITGDRLKDYYITQTAIWWYLDETTGSGNLGSDFKVNASDPNGIRKYIKDLVDNAKKAKENGYPKATLSLNTTSNTMKLSSDKKYYISESLSVTGTNITAYTVSVSSGASVIAADGSEKTTFAASEKFKIKMPVSQVNNTQTAIKVEVTSEATVNKVYEYKPEKANMQNAMPAILVPTTKKVTASKTLEIDSSKVSIIKLDKATGQPLAGAELVLKDAAGNTIASWTSTTNAHVIRNLSNGTYTIEETKAPTGYKKLTKTMQFTITDEKKNIQVKIHNEPKESVITITKLDKSTEKPLAGATLVVKNSKGEVVARFTTTTESYVITNLANDTYTVEEESAPAGYQKVNDVIKFTIDDEHLSYQVNFYNYPIVTVPNTSSNSSIIMTIIGLIIIGSTVLYIYKYANR